VVPTKSLSLFAADNKTAKAVDTVITFVRPQVLGWGESLWKFKINLPAKINNAFIPSQKAA